MTAFTDQPQAAAALGDPTTSPLDLMAIAQKYPALWGQIARHPNTYPDLLAWLNQVGDASVRQAVAERTAPATPEPIPDEPIPDEPVAPDEPVVTPDEDVPDDAQAPAHAAADADVRAPDAETDPVPDDSDAEPSTPRRGDTEPEPEPEPEP
ncbi:MAG: hypothetical protein FWF75_05060, partial [Propionibacteriaceae bacterium]|nr:hypothetical protein [Propionibacteriaceae bacterium]